MLMIPTVFTVVNMLLVIAIVVVGCLGNRRMRIAALIGGAFWLVGWLATFMPAVLGMDQTAQILFYLVSGVFHVFAIVGLALAGMLPPPARDAYPRTSPTYTPNPRPYGTGQSGGYDHLPRAGEAPPRNFPQS